MTEPQTPQQEAPPPVAESRGQRLSRHGHRTFLYIWTFAGVAAVVVLIALVAANTHTVKISWVFGDTRTSLIWIIVVSGIAGWLAGIGTAVFYRFRTRGPRRR